MIDTPKPSSMLIKFCVTGQSGLGHIRRIANIAAAFEENAVPVRCVLLTNAPVAGLAQTERDLFESVIVVEKAGMAERLADMPPGPVVVDTAVIPRLALVADPLCLILRESIAERLSGFRLDAGRLWDLVVVPSPRDQWKPDPDALGARSVKHVNWIYRGAAAGADDPVLPPRRGPRILVATGGGGTTESASRLRNVIDDVLERVPGLGAGSEVVQIAGPRLPPAGHLKTATVRIDVGARLDEAFREADLVVSTVGYNSILELAQCDTPALLVPIDRTFDDQRARAEAWGPCLGLAHRVDDVARSREWIARILAASERRHPVDLPPSGAQDAAELIVDLAHAQSDWSFHKATTGGPLIASSPAAHRATSLFMQGVATPCARDGLASDAITMARLSAPTLRESLRTLGGPFKSDVELAGAVREVFLTGGGDAHPLASLRLVKRIPDDVTSFDPLAKVRLRLDRRSEVRRGNIPHVSRAAVLADEIERALRTTGVDSGPVALLHGDFHAGQVLCPQHGVPIIVDLDDLALGPAEADLANFAAHLVTSLDLYVGAIEQGFRTVIETLRDVFGFTDSGSQVRLFVLGAASLLRRALKIEERDRDPGRCMTVIDASEAILREAIAAAGSCRSHRASPVPTSPAANT